MAFYQSLNNHFAEKYQDLIYHLDNYLIVINLHQLNIALILSYFGKYI